MASLFNHIILTNYPKLSSSISTPYTIKPSRLELPFLVNDSCRSSFQFQTQKISPPPIIACSNSSEFATASASWVESSYIPGWARPYAYLMRMNSSHVGCTIITTPCLWSIAISSEPGKIVDAKMVALFAFVGIVYRGIIVTINDILDRDVDAKVKRTKQRPLASGVLTLFQGLTCLGIQMLLCYGLLRQVNDLSRKLWFGSLVLAFTYPLMKRLTFWPQAYLGLLINSFNLCGWSAVKGSLDPRILLPLCTSGFFWTMDKEDDAKVGVKSPALLLGNSTKIWISGFALACIGALMLTGSLTNIGWPYYAALAAASSHLVWQILSVDLNSPEDCYNKFESNTQFGAIVLCGIVLGRLYQ